MNVCLTFCPTNFFKKQSFPHKLRYKKILNTSKSLQYQTTDYHVFLLVCYHSLFFYKLHMYIVFITKQKNYVFYHYQLFKYTKQKNHVLFLPTFLFYFRISIYLTHFMFRKSSLLINK